MKFINLKNLVLIAFGLTCFSILQAQTRITQFGGPNRNGIYNETGLLDRWPESGPELLETITGIGEGFGSPSVTENGIYIAGMIDTIGHVFHFDNNYKLKWKTEIGSEFHFKYVGSRGTPTIEDNRLYYVASMGDAVCLNAVTGEKIWHVNIMEKYHGPEVKWGYAESPLIYGKKGVESDAMFEFIDIYPTLADLFKLEGTPEYIEGKSFIEVLSDPSMPFRNSVRAITRRGEMLGETVKNEKWRYVQWDGGNRGIELYDQINDPIEYNNLANNPDYSETVEEMKEIIYQFE